MEILNQIILAGNLTDQPTVSDAGGRQFIRARLAQSWFYETQGKTVEHRQFIPLTFFGESAIAAKSFQKGDNIHVTGQLIRREARPRPEEANTVREPGTIREQTFTRSTSFAPSASRRNRSRNNSQLTKTIFGARTTRSEFHPSLRRASVIGLFKRSLAASLCAVARLRCVFVPIGALAIGAMFLWTGFGVVFNYTHSAPFGLYREEFDSEAAIHDPAPYVFFCPDRRWPSMRGEPNYRDPMRTCPDGFSPLIKPVVAWPGDLVSVSANGIRVNGRPLPNSAPIERDSKGQQLRPFAARRVSRWP